MNKINFGTLNSANIAVDNSLDTARVYDIKANANIKSGKVASLDSGRVLNQGIEVANFNHWSDNNQQVTWLNCPIEQKDDVQTAIDAFVASVREESVGQTISL